MGRPTFDFNCVVCEIFAHRGAFCGIFFAPLKGLETNNL